MPDSPKPPARDDRRSPTRRDVLRSVLAAPLLAGVGALAANFDGHTASAADVKLIDFADRLVAPERIAAAGYAGAVVYVAESRPGANFDFKPVTRAYADALRAEGLHVVSNYQYGKPGWPTPSDFTRGHDGGVADAQTALRLHAAAGGAEGAPIFFSIDEDIDREAWDAIAVEWFRGINSILGVDRTGIYGGSRACAWAIADDVIGHSSTAGHRWAWQTRAWSAGKREPAAVLLQTTIVTATDPGVLLGDVHVDEDDVLAADFGQWNLAR
jgi:Domain of unknown function (DUF1906)